MNSYYGQQHDNYAQSEIDRQSPVSSLSLGSSISSSSSPCSPIESRPVSPAPNHLNLANQHFVTNSTPYNYNNANINQLYQHCFYQQKPASSNFSLDDSNYFSRLESSNADNDSGSFSSTSTQKRYQTMPNQPINPQKVFLKFSIDAILGNSNARPNAESQIAQENPSQKKRRGRKCDVDNSSTNSKRLRTIFTQEQLDKLEDEFMKQQYMVGSERSYLAQSLNLSESQVKIWFQNRRIKWRKAQGNSGLIAGQFNDEHENSLLNDSSYDD